MIIRQVLQKGPVTFHSTTDSSSLSYMKFLTPYGYKFVAKQLSLLAKVKLQDNGDEGFYVTSTTGNLQVSATSCQCIDCMEFNETSLSSHFRCTG